MEISVSAESIGFSGIGDLKLLNEMGGRIKHGHLVHLQSGDIRDG